ncbi:hypothetical protein [Spiroplasma sp. BIUS-1]|uniref:hypothetical protein n=1 Tax=Spiroplasma sp. BIUS-1 TaxID=216964 RepID=UPI0013970EBB|nr:hypothetical protein [Spiroplasma sp. BIUS-1]QHX36914.1 hypothetical protein SBIUS_v1c06610 [Spiroplasma sp. BIUS-1]
MKFILKNLNNKTFFNLIINLIITFLSIFCSIAIITILFASKSKINNHLITFALINVGFFIGFIYAYKLFNYLNTVKQLKKLKLDQFNKNLFDSLIKQTKIELNPSVYLILAVSTFLIFFCVALKSQTESKYEIERVLFIQRMVISLITFALFEFISFVVIFAFLHFIRQAIINFSTVNKLSMKAYFIFIKVANFVSIKFLEIKHIVLISYMKIVNCLFTYDSNQRNLITVKRSDFLNNQLKGECPPAISF